MIFLFLHWFIYAHWAFVETEKCPFFSSLGSQGGRSRGLSSDHLQRSGLFLSRCVSLPFMFLLLGIWIVKPHIFLILINLLDLVLNLVVWIFFSS